MTIKRAERDNIEALECIGRESLQEMWSSEALSEAIENPQAICLVAEKQQSIYGFLLFFHAAEEGEIELFAVAEKHRNQGAGNALLQQLFKESRQKKIRKIFLEVRQSAEPAKKVYQHNGFQTVGMRPRFYEHPEEDACVMCRKMQ